MNLKTKLDFNWMLNTSNLCVVLWDQSMDVLWTERSVLGPAIRLMERWPLSDASLEKLAQKLGESEKMPARVLLCLPRTLLMQRTLDYPASVQSDLDSMLQFEATRHVPFPETDRRIAYASALWPSQKKLSVNLIAARQSDVASCLARFSELGIPVDFATPLSALGAPSAEELPTMRILADEHHLELVLFADGVVRDSLLLDRPAEDELLDLLGGAVRQISARQQDRLGAEGIGRMSFAGPVPLSMEFQQAFSSSFGLSVTPLELPQEFEPALEEWSGPPLCEALRALQASPPASLNLIDQTHRKVSLSRRTLIVAGLCVLLVAELFVGWAVWTNAPAARLRPVRREIDQLKRRAAPVQAVRDQNRELRRELMQLNEIGRTRVSSMALLKILSDALPNDTYLEWIDYERGDRIRMKGRSKEPDKLPQLLLDLPFIGTIESSEIDEKQNDYHGFSFSATIRSMRDE